MRNKFKCIGILLILTLLVSLIPVNETYAANNLLIGESLATAKTECEMSVGEEIDLNFYGATGYVYKNDAKNVSWSSSNDSVATVNANGIVKGIASGNVTISAKVKVSKTGKTYYGTVNMKISGVSTDTVRQYSYDSFLIKYSSEEEALEAIKKGVEVKRNRKLSNGTYQASNVVSSSRIFEDDKTCICIETTIMADNIYIIYAEGLDKNGYEIVTKLGRPTTISISYPEAYLSSTGQKDITGKSLAYSDIKPTLNVIDENGIIIAQSVGGAKFTGKSGVEGTIKYYKDASTGSCTLASTTGSVRFNKIDQSVTVHATWKQTGSELLLESEAVTVQPIEYVLPDLGDGVCAMTVTTEKGDKIDWGNGELWQASYPAEKQGQIEYYFLGSDNKKYSASANVAASDDIEKLAGTYRYAFQLAEGYGNLCSVTKAGVIKTYNEGVAVIYMWQLEPNKTTITQNSVLVGILELTITEAPKPCTFDAGTYYVYVPKVDEKDPDTGENLDPYVNNGKVKIPFSILDQYGERIKVSSSYLNVKGGATIRLVEEEIDGWKINGYIERDYSNSSNGLYTIEVKYKTEFDEEIDVYVERN